MRIPPHNMTTKPTSKTLRAESALVRKTSAAAHRNTHQAEQAGVIAGVEGSPLQLARIDAQAERQGSDDNKDYDNGDERPAYWIALGNQPHSSSMNVESKRASRAHNKDPPKNIKETKKKS